MANNVTPGSRGNTFTDTRDTRKNNARTTTGSLHGRSVEKVHLHTSSIASDTSPSLADECNDCTEPAIGRTRQEAQAKAPSPDTTVSVSKQFSSQVDNNITCASCTKCAEEGQTFPVNRIDSVSERTESLLSNSPVVSVSGPYPADISIVSNEEEGSRIPLYHDRPDKRSILGESSHTFAPDTSSCSDEYSDLTESDEESVPSDSSDDDMDDIPDCAAGESLPTPATGMTIDTMPDYTIPETRAAKIRASKCEGREKAREKHALERVGFLQMMQRDGRKQAEHIFAYDKTMTRRVWQSYITTGVEGLWRAPSRRSKGTYRTLLKHVFHHPKDVCKSMADTLTSSNVNISPRGCLHKVIKPMTMQLFFMILQSFVRSISWFSVFSNAYNQEVDLTTGYLRV